MAEGDREPCPFRIFEDIGGGFLLGAVGGSVWHFFKGLRNSPRGYRLKGALTAARIRAPVIGGNFGVWGGLFSAFDCSLAAYRMTEDAWNAVLAGALTGGLLASRAGYRAAFSNALGGALILGVIEGLSISINKLTANFSTMVSGGVIPIDKLEVPVPPGFGTGMIKLQ